MTHLPPSPTDPFPTPLSCLPSTSLPQPNPSPPPISSPSLLPLATLAADLLSPSPIKDPSLSFFPATNAENLARRAHKEPDHGDTDRSGGSHGGQARCHGDLARSTGGAQIQQSKVTIGGGCHGPSSSPHAPSPPPFLGDGIGAEEEPALVAQQLPLQRVCPQVPQHQLLSPPPQQDSMSMGTTIALRQVIKSSGRRAGAQVRRGRGGSEDEVDGAQVELGGDAPV